MKNNSKITNLRQIDPECTIATLDRLCARIEERFNGASLSGVARELLIIARSAALHREAIRKPRLIIRLCIGTIFFGALLLLIKTISAIRISESLYNADNFIQTAEALISSSVFLGLAVSFLFSLEARSKRGGIFKLMHELRSIAHIVDMHQLTKDPETVIWNSPDTSSSPDRNMTAFELTRYLAYCSELLSLISKIAAFYVQDFRDPQVLGMVDQIEDLTTGLSQKVWQKASLLQPQNPGKL